MANNVEITKNYHFTGGDLALFTNSEVGDEYKLYESLRARTAS